MEDIVREESGFTQFGLRKELLQALEKVGFKTPSPIQQEVIPLILSGADVIGHAQTGTGKTAAFTLPTLHRLKFSGKPEILVLTPTRELASQVSEEMGKLGSFLRLKTATVYGGSSFKKQIDSITGGAHVIVATPGRLLDLLRGEKIPPLAPSVIVIDEADEMLDMGFLEELQAIFEFLPEDRQTLMFSATMPPAIQGLAKKILKNPAIVKAAQTQSTNEDITQYYCVLHDAERDEAVIRLFEADSSGKSIIFCKMKKEVDRLAQVLTQRGHLAAGLHGDMEQTQREQVIARFRTSPSAVLVATDVAARGINVPDVTRVINYHIPFDPENYVHRIGRTGRAGRKGISITLVTPGEHGKLLRFQKILKGEMQALSVPTKTEIRNLQMTKVLTRAKSAEPADDLLSVIEALEKEGENLKGFAAKLLTIFLQKNPIPGPEKIGAAESTAPKKERPFGRRSERRFSPNRGRSERQKPDSFGRYPKKKFSHPKSEKKPRKSF